jgi:hypothetical protein
MMHPVELKAYSMTLMNGTLAQVKQTLCDIQELEPVVPDELLADIVATLRNQGKAASGELALPIHKLIGKTNSEELYRVAGELGYLELNNFLNHVCVSGKVNLFVLERFYHQEIEPLVVDELHQWIYCLDQTIRQNYKDDLRGAYLEIPEYDSRLKRSQYFSSPHFTIARILTALEAIGTAQSHTSLLAIEYLFRPRLNDYLAIEKERMRVGDERAIREYCELNQAEGVEVLTWFLGSPSVYTLHEFLDRIARLARLGPTPSSVDPVLDPVQT